MLVIRNKKTGPIIDAVDAVKPSILRALPRLPNLAPSQRHGGIVIGKGTRQSYCSPRIFRLKRNGDASEINDVKRLIDIAEVAPFGRGEETVIDERFRKTLRVLPSKIRVEWNPHLGRAV